MTFLDRIVTPKFIAANAHCWFAYAIVFTFPALAIPALIGALVKEFYIDKHFETGQTFVDNTEDFLGYVLGIILACAAHRVGL